jgi:uncharacterized protein
MRKITFLRTLLSAGALFTCTFISYPTLAQKIGDPYPEPRTCLDEGVKLYNDEKYAEAIKKFLLINENDSFYHQAIYELAISYQADKQYEKARARALEGLESNTLFERDFIVTYASILEDLGQKDSAMKVLDHGLVKYPYYPRFLYEKGLIYARMDDWDNTLKCYTEAMKINIYYPYPHLKIGIMAANARKPALALMALNTFCIVSRDDDRILSVITTMEKIAGNEYDPDSFAIDEKHFAFAKELEEVDLIIHSKAALSKKYKGLVKLDYHIVKQMQVLCEKLPDGFQSENWIINFYVKLYKEIWNNKLFAGSALYNLRYIENKNVQSQIKSKLKEVNAFKEWAGTYLNKLRNYQTTMVNGQKKDIRLWYNNDNELRAIGDEDAQGNNTGQWVYYGDYGYKSAEGSFEANKKAGAWKYYYDNGSLKSVEEYKEGKNNGLTKRYYRNGSLEETGNYENEQLRGEVRLYNPNNTVKLSVPISNTGKLEGIRYNYNFTGQLVTMSELKNSSLEGSYKTYYATGELDMDAKCTQGDLNGPVVYYYPSGKVQLTGTFMKGNRHSDWKWTYENGTTETTGSYNNGKETGLWKYYYDNGVLQKEENYENGAKKGSYRYFDREGKIYADIFVKGGKIDAYKYYDKAGKVITEGKTNGGRLHYVFYSASRNRIIEGDYVNGLEDGTWKYYYQNGALEYELPYSKGKREGVMKYYYKNGKDQYQVMYTDDQREGFYRSYFSNGKIETEGYYKDGQRSGTWDYYHANGTFDSREFYLEDEIRGRDYDYMPDGRLYGYSLYDHGFFNNYTLTDSSGKAIYSTGLKFGTGIYELYTPTNKLTFRGYYKAGVKDSLQTQYYGANKLSYTEWFHMGKETGPYRRYHENGKVKSAGISKQGEQDSVWNYFNEQGGPSQLITFKNGKYDGKYVSYYSNGKPDVECNYVAGELEGSYKQYGFEGALIFDAIYNGGVLVSYSWPGKDGKPVTPVEVKEETANIVTYFPNGNVALKFSIDHGYKNGAYLKNFENGKPAVEATYIDNEIEGVYKVYYLNGNLKRLENYLYDELDGKCVEYHENGKVARETTYLFGYKHGISKTYDATGKLTGTTTYYYGKIL